MKTIVTLAAVGAALLIGSPAFAGSNSYNTHSSHHSSHTTYSTPHHTTHHRHYQPSYTYTPTYHKPVYAPTYQEPTVEIKKVEICWAIKKNHYGHAFKYQVACPHEKVVVIKKEVSVEKTESEQPVEKKEETTEQK